MSHSTIRLKRATITALALCAAVIVSIHGARAAADAVKSCRVIFRASELPVADLRLQAAENYASDNVETFKKLEILRARKPHLTTNEPLMRALIDLLRDEELSIFHQMLGRVFDKVVAQEPYRPGGAPEKSLKDVFAEDLANYMRRPEADERAAIFESYTVTKEKLVRALGLKLEENLEALVGPRGIENIGRGSLVSRYLSEARRAGVNTQTVVANFRKGPPSEAHGTEKRLFISVDARTAPIAQKIFGNNPHFLIHEHEPDQSTLQMHHAGRSAAYSKYHDGTSVLGSAMDTIAPLVALSTTEASRVENYFQLGKLTRGSRAKYPWSLKKKVGESVETYCRLGGYTSCTHWIGEMPIGDRRVDKYSFPGQFDSYADQADPLAKRPSAIRTGAVGTYTHFEVPSRPAEEIGTTTRTDRLTRMVWRQGQGHQQLWQMLQARGPLSRGEFANPGWVLYALLADAPSSRVPVVLIYRENAADPLTQADIDRLTGLINPT